MPARWRTLTAVSRQVARILGPASRWREAPIFAETDILDVVEAVFDPPVATPQRKQAISRTDVRRQAGDPVVERLVVPVAIPSGAVQAEDLGRPGPIAVADEVRGGEQVAGVGVAAVPLVDGAGLPGIVERQRGEGGIEEKAEVIEQVWLVRLDQEEIVTTGIQDLLAELPLAEAGVTGEHPPVPVELGDELGHDREFGFGLLSCARDRHLGEDETLLMTVGGELVHRGLGRLGEGQPAPLGFAVDGDPLADTGNRRRRCVTGEVLAQGGRQRGRLEAPEEARQRRLVRGDTVGETERGEDLSGLAGAPFGDGQHRRAIGEDGGDGQGEDRGQGVAGPLAALAAVLKR